MNALTIALFLLLSMGSWEHWVQPVEFLLAHLFSACVSRAYVPSTCVSSTYVFSTFAALKAQAPSFVFDRIGVLFQPIRPQRFRNTCQPGVKALPVLTRYRFTGNEFWRFA